MNKSMHDKIAHKQLKKRSHYSQWKNITDCTGEHSGKNIGSESQNTLTVNETQSKLKQFPFNIVHLITLRYSTQHFLQQVKFAISGCKMKIVHLTSDPLQVFLGEKAPVSSNFPIFKLNQLTAWVAPKTCDLSVPQNV